MAIIDYYYYSSSPFTYMGHRHIQNVARENGCGLAYKPVDLFQLWDVSGAVMPPKRPPVRQRYRIVELRRCADFRGLPINVRPAFWPVDAKLADCCTIALLEERLDPSDFTMKLLSGVWADEKNIADETVLSGMLTECGFDASSILEAAKTEEIMAIRQRNTDEAIAADAVGVPAYVLNGEVFWGQDRIDHLDHALKTGRAPITAE